MKSYSTFSYATVLLMVLLTLLGCSKGDAPRPDDVAAVRQVMELRAQAMASKDIAAFEQLLHEEYNDGPNTKADILEYMREVFARYDQIAMKYQKAPVELKMNTARVVQRLEFKVNQETQIIHDHELLMLRKSNGVWQISGGIKLGVL